MWLEIPSFGKWALNTAKHSPFLPSEGGKKGKLPDLTGKGGPRHSTGIVETEEDIIRKFTQHLS